MKGKDRQRAVAEPGSEVPQMRYEIYKHAFERIKTAVTQGFYLEAITIIESLIADRLEHRLSHTMGKDVSFKTLGKLINKTEKNETDDELKGIVTNQLNAWTKKRNTAIHEMAKIADGEVAVWGERMKDLSIIAEEGKAILDAINKRCRQLKDTNQ